MAQPAATAPWHAKVFWLQPATASREAATALVAQMEVWLNSLPKCDPPVTLTIGTDNFHNGLIVVVREA